MEKEGDPKGKEGMRRSRSGSKAQRGKPGNQAQEHGLEGPTPGQENEKVVGRTVGGKDKPNGPKGKTAAIYGNRMNAKNVEVEDEDDDEELEDNF